MGPCIHFWGQGRGGYKMIRPLEILHYLPQLETDLPLPQRNSGTCAAGDTHRMSDASLFVAVQPLKRKSWAAASQSLSAPKSLSAPQSGNQRLLSGVLSKQDTPFTLECLVFPFYKTGKPTFYPSLS